LAALRIPQRIHRRRLSDLVKSRMGERDDDHSQVEQNFRSDPAAFAALVRRLQRMIYTLT